VVALSEHYLDFTGLKLEDNQRKKLLKIITFVLTVNPMELTTRSVVKDVLPFEEPIWRRPL
jgi:hypothetical protein